MRNSFYKARKNSHIVEHQRQLPPALKNVFENRSSTQMPALTPKNRTQNFAFKPLNHVPGRPQPDYFSPNDMGEMDDISIEEGVTSLPLDDKVANKVHPLSKTATTTFGVPKRSVDPTPSAGLSLPPAPQNPNKTSQEINE